MDTLNVTPTTITSLQAEKTPEAYASLQQIAATTADKEIKKLAKRAIYLLEREGIHQIDSSQDGQEEALWHVEDGMLDGVRCYLSFADSDHNRTLVFYRPSKLGSVELVQVLAYNSFLGIHSSGGIRVPIEQLQAQNVCIPGNIPTDNNLVEIDIDFALYLLQNARQINKARFKRMPTGYHKVMDGLGSPKTTYTAPPIFQHLNPQDVLETTEIPIIGFSDPNPAYCLGLQLYPGTREILGEVVNEVMPYAMELFSSMQASDDKTDPEKMKQFDMVAETWCERLLNPAERHRISNDLLDNAYLMWLLGHEALAKEALCHAVLLVSDKPLLEQVYPVYLTRKSINYWFLLAIEPYMKEITGLGDETVEEVPTEVVPTEEVNHTEEETKQG